MSRLFVRTGPLAGRRIEVDRELVIGRSDADVVMDDDELSRRHVIVRPAPGGLEIEDLGSTNGTLVDGQRVDGPIRLTNGAIVQLGNTVLEVEGVDALQPTRVRQRSPDPDATRIRAAPAAATPSRPSDEIPPPRGAGTGALARATSLPVRFITGRRTKVLVIVASLAAIAVLGKASVNITKVQKSATVDYLPSRAESSKALKEAVRFPAGRLTEAAVIYRRDGGLTAADKTLVESNRAAIGKVKYVGSVDTAQYSKDGTSALILARVQARAPGVLDAVKSIRNLVGHGSNGLVSFVTGPAGFTQDAANVFGSIDTTLFLATLGLILTLLIIIYRSPIFWIVPIFAIVFAVATSRGLAYYLATGGITITGQSSGIMTVLIFGVGTDYALLMVARYREALGREQDSHVAAAEAIREAASAVVPSALTVIAGLLCLELAEVKSTSGLGAIGAAGVALAMLAMLTLLPALLCVFGRRIFWPFIPRIAGSSEEASGVWERIALKVAAAARRVWITSLLLLVVMAVGLLDLNSSLTSANDFRNTVDSVAGQRLVARAFPPGVSAPSFVIVPDSSRVATVQSAAKGTGRVATLGQVDKSGGAAYFEVSINQDPYGESGFTDINMIRSAVHAVGGGNTLVGGATSQELDLRTAQSRDNLLIIPIVLALILIILTVLLRAAVAPLLLIGTVVASYAATLGFVSFLFTKVFHYQGLDPSLPLLGFIMLVALGVDYNIFLMTRVRHETAALGARRGVTRGLAVTGGVITSAGLVLTGTFAMLAVLPLVVLTEIGLMVAIGALLDTFLVRSLLVPALVQEIGPATWWPSRLWRAEEASG